MSLCSRLINISVLLIGLPHLTFAQQADDLSDYWLLQSQITTDRVIKDAVALVPVDRALLWARLGSAWWKEDPGRAHQWLKTAVETVESSTNQESPADLRRRLARARSLLTLVAPLDHKLAARLTVLLTADSESTTEAERGINADALIEAAIAVVDNDSKRAAEMGAASLRIGRPTRLAALLWKLRKRDATLADALFRQALAIARASQDANLLSSLKLALFSELDNPADSSKSNPLDPLRAELLQVFAEYLQKDLNSSNDQTASCSSSWPMIAMIGPLLPQFYRLLPLQAVGVRQLIIGCRPSLSPLARQQTDCADNNLSPQTVDDLLKAADDAADLKVKTVYQFRAAQLLVRQEAFDRAVSILESMDSDARKFMGGSWEAYRWEWAAFAAFAHFKRQDLTRMQQVINAVPSNLRHATQIQLANDLSDKKYSSNYGSLAIELIEDARKGFRRANISDADKANGYLFLVRLYVKFSPQEVIAVLKEAVAALNRVEQTKPTEGEHLNDNTTNPLSETWWSEYFSAPRLREDDYAVAEIVSSIESPTKRIQARLGLLNVALDRYRKASKTPITQKARGAGQ